MQRLLQLLADGELHSGSELAAALGMTRSAVWKQVHQLESLGLEFAAAAGRGYRLETPLELLDSGLLRSELQAHRTDVDLTVLWETASTSSYCLEQGLPSPGRARVCLAEYQSAGRGRRGRSWFAPAGHGVSLSVGWGFAESPANLSCLGLAAGVAVLRAVRAAGVTDAQLKWPNDLILDGRKLAGILIDVQGEAGGPLHVVVGVGLNWYLNAGMRAAIVAGGGLQPAAITASASLRLGRNQFAAGLIKETVNVLENYSAEGFAPLAAEYLEADYLAGRAIDVLSDSGTMSGVACGIAPDGRLRVRCGGREQLLVTGDVSISATG